MIFCFYNLLMFELLIKKHSYKINGESICLWLWLISYVLSHLDYVGLFYVALQISETTCSEINGILSSSFLWVQLKEKFMWLRWKLMSQPETERLAGRVRDLHNFNIALLLHNPHLFPSQESCEVGITWRLCKKSYLEW